MKFFTKPIRKKGESVASTRHPVKTKEPETGLVSHHRSDPDTYTDLQPAEVKSKNLKQISVFSVRKQDLARMEIENKEAENGMSDRVLAEQQINRLEREKYLAEIDHKNAELASLTICLVNKNEILGEIREKLKNNHHTENIHEVVQFINSNTDIDQDWLKFQTTFEMCTPDFLTV